MPFRSLKKQSPTKCVCSDHLKALSVLRSSLEKESGPTKDNLDLILRWMSLRLYAANTSVTIRVLSFVELLVRSLEQEV